MDNTILNGYNPNTIFVGYSPNDFFYSTADYLAIMPSDSACKTMKPYESIWNTSCNATNFADASLNCINKELCKNKDYSTKLLKINKGNANSDEKYYNVKQEYDTIFMSSINLGVGCLFLLILILKINGK
jgi:hypothetical protein